jgi:zinc transport system permease protein
MLAALEYDFFVRAVLAGLLSSLACGVIGTYVVTRRMASISGGLSHAAFGGLGLAHLLGFDPVWGATGFALACGAGLGYWSRRSQNIDTMIAMVWALGMALGMLFISFSPGYAADLMSYLFGSILFVPNNYLSMLLLLDISILILVGLFFRELQAVSFDEEYATVVGLPVTRLYLLQLTLISLVVVALIQVVGVVLVIALLTIPATVARQWTDRLGRMMALASVIGAFCCTAGLFVSWWLSTTDNLNVPTGPIIILMVIAVHIISSILRRLKS